MPHLLPTTDKTNRIAAIPDCRSGYDKPRDAHGLYSDIVKRIETDSGRYTACYAPFRLSSHFQAIVSLPHCRVVGHEGLIRVHDADGKTVPPGTAFQKAAAKGEIEQMDRLTRALHILNRGTLQENLWLFLNVHAEVLLSGDFGRGQQFFECLLRDGGLAPNQIVIEVLEHAIADDAGFAKSLASLRDLGCLIAIDDFGSGHSNFDRIWRFQPDIVKLDKSFADRIETDARARRLLSSIVALLHETGALVLLEGIETRTQALAALEANIDFAQGYFFAYPIALPVTQAPDVLEQLWKEYDLSHQKEYREEARLAPHRSALLTAATAIGAGTSPEQACAGMLGLENALFTYLLDADGNQASANLLADPDAHRSATRFAPLLNAAGARWAHRPYFREAICHFGELRITRPYLSATTGKLCTTLSIAFRRAGQTLVLCFDVAGEETASDAF